MNNQEKSPLLIRLVASSVTIANRSGKIVRDVMNTGNLNIVEKGINDLQTEADRKVQSCILSSLYNNFHSIKIVGEENLDIDIKPDWVEDGQCQEVLSYSSKIPAEFNSIHEQDICVWVDPLDATYEYALGNLDHVTVLIGIAVKGRAVAGVIHQPFYKCETSDQQGRTLWGIVGLGAFGFEREEHKEGSRVIVTTKSHETELVMKAVQACQPTKVLKLGGAGYKILQLIEGKADAYIYANPGLRKWDTCATEAILRSAGGELSNICGERLLYHHDVCNLNEKGVVATAYKDQQQWYLDKIPSQVKEALSN